MSINKSPNSVVKYCQISKFGGMMYMKEGFDMENKYLRRIADKLLQERLEVSGAVLIEGPKWCGKTRTAKEFSNSQLYMQDPDKRVSYLKAADTKPSLLLKGETPKLLDEWQMAPILWDAVRHEVDIRSTVGQFILTGSAVPKEDLNAQLVQEEFLD